MDIGFYGDEYLLRLAEHAGSKCKVFVGTGVMLDQRSCMWIEAIQGCVAFPTSQICWHSGMTIPTFRNSLLTK